MKGGVARPESCFPFCGEMLREKEVRGEEGRLLPLLIIKQGGVEGIRGRDLGGA